LQAARDATSLPCLRKDFTVDEVQVYEARAIGADAILLIVAAIHDDALLADLHALAIALGLGVLVEAHDAGEVERALRAGARVVGVNSRDLSTFAEDLVGATGLSTTIPPKVIAAAPGPLRPRWSPGTREPVGPADCAALFPVARIEQEMTQAPTVEIPGAVIDILRLWRPPPLLRAKRLEETLGTPARIYYKDESGSPSGSHKTNTAVAQAFYNRADGTKRIATETGAG